MILLSICTFAYKKELRQKISLFILIRRSCNVLWCNTWSKWLAVSFKMSSFPIFLNLLLSMSFRCRFPHILKAPMSFKITSFPMYLKQLACNVTLEETCVQYVHAYIFSLMIYFVCLPGGSICVAVVCPASSNQKSRSDDHPTGHQYAYLAVWCTCKFSISRNFIAIQGIYNRIRHRT